MARTLGGTINPGSTVTRQSRLRLLGFPLLAIATGHLENGKYRRGRAVGWLAIGDLAIGFVAIGAVAIGGLSVGGLSLGLLAVGGVAAGGWALGGIAAGYLAAGGLALAWHAAVGGLAIAKDVALGGVAHARHANDATTAAVIANDPLLRWQPWVLAHSQWFILLAFLPAVAGTIRRVRRGQEHDRAT
jgi:hypothetical protein